MDRRVEILMVAAIAVGLALWVAVIQSAIYIHDAIVWTIDLF